MDYGKAEGIRKKGLAGLITDNLVEGKGIGSSFGSAISDRTKATFTGIQEKFDPLNIAKKLTGGSNLAPALLGRLMGRKESTLEYFAKPKRKVSAKGVNFETGDALDDNQAVEVLGFIYRELKRAELDRELLAETAQEQEKKREDDEDKRNQEIIAALTGRKEKKETTKEKAKRKKEEVKVKKETKKAPTKKAPPTKKEVPPKVEVPKVQAPKPPAKVTIPKGAVSTAAKVAAGVGVLTLAGKVSAKISGNESAGNYNQANIVGKAGKEHIIEKGNLDVTTGKPFEKSLTEMSISEVAALGRRRYKHYGKKGGSAMGKYQFIPGTLESVAKNLYGENWETKPYDEKAQEDLNASFLMGNAKLLQKAGLKVSDASLYMMHFFGNATQAAMVINGPEDVKMSEVLDYWYSQGKQKSRPSVENPGVANLTVGEYKKRLGQKYKFDFVELDVAKLAEPIAENNTGNTIDVSSKERKDLQKTENKDKPAINVNNTTVNQPSSPTPQKQKETEDDTPAPIKKRRG
jgi:outer membrane biosynthesis protein TonB